MDIKNFSSAITQLAEDKGIPKEKVLEVIEQAFAAAYKKDYGKKSQVIKAKLDSRTGQVKFWQIKQVVDESMLWTEEELKELLEKHVQEEDAEQEKPDKFRFNPEKHIMLEDAQKEKPSIKVGEELEIPLPTEENYGRIAAQTAKQVILQRLKEAERDIIFDEFSRKEGELISGIVQRVEGRNVYFDISKTAGILPKEEQIPGEFYRLGQRLKLYVMKVDSSPRGPVIFLSRNYPKLVSKLFEMEVPEIAQGLVEIKAIAREPGSRTKIAVMSTDEKVDPIGSVVGQKGTRVSAVIQELGGEKIDIIEYSETPEKFIANSLSPAKVGHVQTEPRNKALCLVPEDQLSLAIGKEGQNVRLAAKLTGWKIDVRPMPEKSGEKSADEEKASEKPKKRLRKAAERQKPKN
jgi:N utilization substance protein A